MIRLTLPYPPTDNHLHTLAAGRKVLSAGARAYYHRVAQECLMQLVGIPRPLTTRLGLTLDIHPPDARKRDIANILKSLGDSLQKAGVYLDDSQIDTWTLTRRGQVPHGCVDVTIVELAYETL